MAERIKKCIGENPDLAVFLEGCKALRPGMAHTWQVIGDIPEDEPQRIEAQVMFFSCGEENEVPLIEELVLKGWQSADPENKFVQYLDPPKIQRIFDFLGIADPAKLIQDFVNLHPKVLFAGILTHMLKDGKTIQTVLRSVGSELIHHTKGDENRKFYAGATSLIFMIRGQKSEPETLKALIEAVGDDQNFLDAEDDEDRTAVHWCAALNLLDSLQAIIPFSPNMEVQVRQAQYIPADSKKEKCMSHRGISARIEGSMLPRSTGGLPATISTWNRPDSHVRTSWT